MFDQYAYTHDCTLAAKKIKKLLLAQAAYSFGAQIGLGCTFFVLPHMLMYSPYAMVGKCSTLSEL